MRVDDGPFLVVLDPLSLSHKNNNKKNLLDPRIRPVVIFQETARNHFSEAGMLMQS